MTKKSKNMAPDQKTKRYAYMEAKRAKPKTNIELTILMFQEMIAQDPGSVYSNLLLLYKHVALSRKKLRSPNLL